jgi:hypothetical protein
MREPKDYTMRYLELLLLLVLVAGCSDCASRCGDGVCNSSCAEETKCPADCPRQIVPKEAAQPTLSGYEAHLVKAKAIRSFEGSYLSNVSVMKGDSVYTTEIRGKSYKKADKGYTELEIMDGMRQTQLQAYNIDGKYYLCDQGQCNLTTTVLPLDSASLLGMFEAVYQKGAMDFFGSGQSSVNGRPCEQINMDIDLSKLSTKEMYFVLALAGLSTVPDPDSYIPRMREFSIRSCVADGIDLQSEYRLRLRTTEDIMLQVATVVTNYTIDGAIDDSVFGLPE